MDHPAADQAADLVGRDVVAGEHRDARPGVAGAAAVSMRLIVGMRVRRAQEIGVGLARPVDVVDVAALAGDETWSSLRRTEAPIPVALMAVLPAPVAVSTFALPGLAAIALAPAAIAFTMLW